MCFHYFTTDLLLYILISYSLLFSITQTIGCCYTPLVTVPFLFFLDGTFSFWTKSFISKWSFQVSWILFSFCSGPPVLCGPCKVCDAAELVLSVFSWSHHSVCFALELLLSEYTLAMRFLPLDIFIIMYFNGSLFDQPIKKILYSVLSNVKVWVHNCHVYIKICLFTLVVWSMFCNLGLWFLVDENSEQN